MTNTGFDFNGISMSTYSQNGYDGLAYKNLLPNALDTGANYVELSSVSLIDVNTGVVSDLIDKSVNETVSIASLGSLGLAIDAARAKVVHYTPVCSQRG